MADIVDDTRTAQWQRDEELLASATKYLISGGAGAELLAAHLVLACEFRSEYDFNRSFGPFASTYVNVEMRGPRAAYEVFRDDDHAATQALRTALQAVLGHDEALGSLSARASHVQIDPDGVDWHRRTRAQGTVE